MSAPLTDKLLPTVAAEIIKHFERAFGRSAARRLVTGSIDMLIEGWERMGDEGKHIDFAIVRKSPEHAETVCGTPREIETARDGCPCVRVSLNLIRQRVIDPEYGQRRLH